MSDEIEIIRKLEVGVTLLTKPTYIYLRGGYALVPYTAAADIESSITGMQ